MPNVGRRCTNGNCPGRMKVRKTRQSRDGTQTKRRRVCKVCGARQTTIEKNYGPCQLSLQFEDQPVEEGPRVDVNP